MSRNYVLILVEGGEVTDTTVVGSAETIPVVIDFDNLEIDADAAREKLAELNDINLGDPSGNLDDYKNKLQGIVDEFDAEEEGEDEDMDDDEDEESYEDEDIDEDEEAA